MQRLPLKGKRRRLSLTLATQLVELATRVEEEPDTFPVLADAILEMSWYDTRVMPMVRGCHPSSAHRMDASLFEAFVEGRDFSLAIETDVRLGRVGGERFHRTYRVEAPEFMGAEFARAVRAAILFGTWGVVLVPWAEKELRRKRGRIFTGLAAPDVRPGVYLEISFDSGQFASQSMSSGTIVER
jgi:hypothetical protein